MPAALAPIAGSFIGGQLGSAYFATTMLGTSAYAATIAVFKAATTMVLASVFAPDQDQPKIEARGIQLNTNNPVGPINVVYGAAKVGGNRVFVHAQGAKNDDLYMVFTLSEGEIEGYPTDQNTDLFIADKSLGNLEVVRRVSADFSGYSTIYGIKMGGVTYNSSSPVTPQGFYDYVVALGDYASKPWTIEIASNVLTITGKTASSSVPDGNIRVFRKGQTRSDEYGAYYPPSDLWTAIKNGNVFGNRRGPHIEIKTRAAVRYDDFTITLHTGTDSQTADPTFVNDLTQWTSDHRLRGVAYIAAKFNYNEKIFSNFPVITALIKGTKVYDPRTATTIWSDNPAICIRDYMINNRYGVGLPSALIDDTAFIASANYCDTMVCSLGTSYTDRSSCEDDGGSWNKRYTMNGVVDINRKPFDNLKEMVTSCRGFLVFSGGKWKLLIDKDETPTFTFNEDNITGSWSIDLGGKDVVVNRVRAEFSNRDIDYAADIAHVDSDAYRTQDNGLVLERTLQLPFTSNYDEAQRIATIDMNQSRQAISCSFTATIQGLRAEIGDIVYLTHSTPAWTNKLFRVMALDILNNDEVSVTVREHDPNVYDYGNLDVKDAIPDTNLPNPYAAAEISNLEFVVNKYYTTAQGTISWDEPTGGFVSAYDITITPTEDSDQEWIWDSWEDGRTVTTSNNYFNVSGLEHGFYKISVAAVNALGVKGDTTSIDIQINKPPIPGRVTGIELDLGADGQSNGDTWEGKDCKIKWQPSSYFMAPEIDESTNADSGSLDWYHKDYEVQVYNGSTLLRTEYVTDTWYIYTYEKNAEDAAKNSATAYRELTFHVRARGKQNQVSEVPAIL